MEVNLGKVFTNENNTVSRSSCTHRENLQRYNGPITSKEDFDDHQIQLNNMVSFICITLDLPVPVPSNQVFAPLENPFECNEVMVLH